MQIALAMGIVAVGLTGPLKQIRRPSSRHHAASPQPVVLERVCIIADLV